MEEKKKGIIYAIIGIILAIIVLICFLDTNVYVRTSLPGGFINPGTTSSYRVNTKLKLKYSIFNDSKIEKRIISYEGQLEDGLDVVKKVDSSIFIGKYNDINELIFIIGDYYYYYRDNVYNKFYRYDKKTGKIDEFKFSSFALNVGKNTISMHNFVVSNCIRTEALINYYPKLAEQIKNTKGQFYIYDTFYDKGRVFYSVNDVLYEYDYAKNKVKKVCKISKAADISYVFVK